MKLNKRKTLGILAIAVFIIIQLFGIDETLPPVVETENFYNDKSVPEDVRALLRNACRDCHSNETEYPWYINIQPLGWWLKGHIENGREQLNFSKWNSYDDKRKARKVNECIEVMEQRRMPYKSYTWIHKKAQLSDDDYERLIAYFESVK